MLPGGLTVGLWHSGFQVQGAFNCFRRLKCCYDVNSYLLRKVFGERGAGF